MSNFGIYITILTNHYHNNRRITMQSRFDFLEDYFPKIAGYGKRAEESLGRDNNICLLNLGRIAEASTEYLCARNNIPFSRSLSETVQALRDKDIIDEDIFIKIKALTEVQDDALHEDYDSEMACGRLMTAACGLCEWLVSTRKFEFLKDLFIPSSKKFPLADLAGLGREAEDDMYTRPRYCLLCIGNMGEIIIEILGEKYRSQITDNDTRFHTRDALEFSSTIDKSMKIKILERNAIINNSQRKLLDDLREPRNKAVHMDTTSREDINEVIHEALTLCTWIFRKILAPDDVIRAKIDSITPDDIHVSTGPIVGVVQCEEIPEGLTLTEGEIRPFRVMDSVPYPEDCTIPVKLSLKHVPKRFGDTGPSDDSFLELCRTGDSSEILEALSHYANPNAVDPETRTTALMYASDHCTREVVDSFIGKGAKTNALNDNNDTALIFAVRGNNDKATEALLRHKADVWTVNNENMTALEYAQENPDEDSKLLTRLTRECTIKFLAMCRSRAHNEEDIITALIHGVNPNIRTVNAKFSALMYAAQYKNAEVVSELLERGARVNDKNKAHDTALILAARYNDEETVEALLDYEADISQENREKYNAFYFANLNPKITSEELLARLNPQTEPETTPEPVIDEEREGLRRNFLKICRSGTETEIREALEAGADIHAVNKSHATALMFAVRHNSAEAVNVLLEAGADVNAQDDDGNTALIYAAGYCDEDMLEVLTGHGADGTITNSAGYGAIDYARGNYRLTEEDIAKYFTLA